MGRCMLSKDLIQIKLYMVYVYYILTTIEFQQTKSVDMSLFLEAVNRPSS